jgi:hypothetical protein
MANYKLARIFGVLLMMLIWGCGGGGDDGAPVGDCYCDFTSWTDTSAALNITFEKQTVAKPANVSVLFKVQTKDGQPVPGLAATDFTVYENDAMISQYESQQAIIPKPGQFKSHIMLLLDLSGSILKSDSLTKVKQAARSFISAVMPDSGTENFGAIDMAIYWFDGAADIHQLVSSFVTDKNFLLSSIDGINENMSSDASTNLYGAVISGVDKVKKAIDSSQQFVSVGSLVMFTDGTDQAGRKKKEDALNAVNNADKTISIYSIGLGGEIDEAVLKGIGKNGFVLAQDLEELVPKFEQIAAKIKDDVNSHYLLQYCSPKRKASHTLKLVAKSKDLSGTLKTCFCATGFEGGCKVTVPSGT